VKRREPLGEKSLKELIPTLPETPFHGCLQKVRKIVRLTRACEDQSNESLRHRKQEL
jgi:hypothetical protein